MSALACDVLVVGLGPAGAAAARTAGASGLDVIAIDRRQAPGIPVQCAEYVPAPLAAHMPRAEVRLQPVDVMITTLPSGRVERSPLPGFMVDRARFDCALVDAARRHGASVLLGTRLENLDASARTALIVGAGGGTTIRYRALVAADGPGSRVARLLGLTPLAVIRTRQYTVPLAHARSSTDVFLSDRYPGGYAWLFPKGRIANLGLGLDDRAGAPMKAPLDALHAALVAVGQVGPQVLGRTGGAIPVGGLRDRLLVERTLFVGDAAGFTHPITGAGIASAVLSGEAAGGALAAFLHGRADALADWQDEMREQFGPTLAHAARRRREMAPRWRSAEAATDGFHRAGWIAFPEYFRPSQSLPEAA